jgi:hypothetical protein
VCDLALPMSVHVTTKGLRLAELEGAKPAFIHLAIILPSTALPLYSCTHLYIEPIISSSYIFVEILPFIQIKMLAQHIKSTLFVKHFTGIIGYAFKITEEGRTIYTL